MRALQVAVAAVRPAQGREALWKLGLDTIDGDAAGDVAVTATVPELPGLPALREARGAAPSVSFGYRGKDRRLDPYGLLLRDRLLVRRRARPRARRAAHVPRRPHRGRRRRSTRTRRSSAPPASTCAAAFPSDPKELGGPSEAGATAVVRVDAGRAGGRRARARRRSGSCARGADGSIDVEVPCANLPAFRSWVLGLLDHAEVLGPPDVRAAVVAWLQAHGRRHDDAAGARPRSASPPARDAAVADGAGRGAARRRGPPLRHDARPRWRATSSWRRCAGCRRSSTR